MQSLVDVVSVVRWPDQHTNNINKGFKSIIEYVHYVHDIISVRPHNNVHNYCRSYVLPQIYTACSRF